MKYTFNKGFYEQDEERLNIKDSLRWNLVCLKSKVGIPLYYSRKAEDFKSELRYKLFHLRLFLVVKIVVIKLTLRGRKKITVEKSPFSESVYIYYYYDGVSRNYVKIRVSGHRLKHSNSNLNILLK